MKIWLNNISTYEIANNLQALECSHITTCEELYNEIFVNKNTKLETKEIISFLQKSIKTLEKLDHNGILWDTLNTIPVYSQQEEIVLASNYLSGSVLPFLSNYKYNNINYKHLSIAELKKYTSHLDSHGTLIMDYFKNVSYKDILHLIEMLQFFDKYLELYYQNNFRLNPFNDSFEMKKELILKNKIEILGELFYDSENFIFGEIDKHQADEIFKGASGHFLHKAKANSLFDIIASYSLTEEVTASKIPLSLNRFKKTT